MPRFDAAGLVTAVVLDSASGDLLMVAHMDAEAIEATRTTGLAHFHSRSRGRLWMKGETSGHVLKVIEIRVDCDQDALETCGSWQRDQPATRWRSSCFYRRLTAEGALERIQD